MSKIEIDEEVLQQLLKQAKENQNKKEKKVHSNYIKMVELDYITH